jgi:aspartate ammonia-lyase
MNTAEIRALLRKLSFLEGLTEGDLHFLGKQLKPVEFHPGEAIFSEGMERVRMCIIYSGTVAIEKHSSGDEAPPVRLATLGRGEAIGEGVLLDDTPHGTSAVALDETKVLQLLKTQVQDLLRERPSVYAALVGSAARTISQRLRATDATLVGRGRSLGFGSGGSRTEKDLLGERQVPKEALYGIQTLRALENFPISGTPLREFPALINGLAMVKEAAARANAELGLLDGKVAEAIASTAHEIRQGRHHEHFLVDMIQGGAGTSTNMNANEVIANRACELLGRGRGDYTGVHPHSHVNLHQSTNDVYPTAIKIALHLSIEELRAAMRELASAFLRKGEEFSAFVKMGRTQLQDAVPMTLGQEFTAFGHTMLEDVDRLGEAQALIREINMGATAIGTGLNAPSGYAEAVRRQLAEISGLELITSPDLVEATADTGAFVQLSGVLKRCAVKLSKICNDLRLLSSGPRTGLGEINLPPRQPGSSIMPGKVNPVIPEMVNQVCFEIIGGDVTVTMAAEAGQLQLNVFEPVIGYRLLHGIDILRNACHVLQHRCVEGITANPDRMRSYVENSIGVVTALVPVIGYDAATEIAREAAESGKGVYELVLERELMSQDELERALNPEAMVGGPRGGR